MPVSEIASFEDALFRLDRCFGPSEQNERYARLVAFLSSDDFARALVNVSGHIWDFYNSEGIAAQSNRFTRAILEFAFTLGFEKGTNVVLTAPADPVAFGTRIKTGHLWKDSFALGHGEFAHSYQWLSAGSELKWGKDTAAVYKSTAGRKSRVPMFVRDPGGIAVRSAFLWEWLVDCTKYQDSFDGEVNDAVAKWVNDQLEKWCQNKPTHACFIASFFKGEDQDLKPVMPPDLFKEVYLPRRGKAAGELRNEISQKFAKPIALYQADLAKLFPVRSALSKTTYRNANNVTSLVRDNKSWFISAYEQYRFDTLYQKQNAKLVEKAAHVLADLIVEEGYLEINSNEDFLRAIKDVERDLRVKDAVPNGLMLNDPKFFQLLKDSYWSIVNRLLYENRNDVPKSSGEQKRRKEQGTGVFRGSIQPIQALKQERQQHYIEPPRTGAGWQTAADDKTIFEKKTFSPVMKQVKVVTFHNKPGTINQSPGAYVIE